MVKASPLLSNKPVIYAANLSESDFTGDIEKNEQYRAVCEIAKAENSVVLPICAQIEAEIADMSAEDKEMFLSELGLKESGLNRIIKQGYSLLGVRIFTGRTHQIRVHMASIKHPLLGDDVYGPKKSKYTLEGQCLHAKVLGFVHPRTGEYMEFEVPLPEYFEKLLNKLDN